LVEDLKKGQSEVNTLDQKKGSHSEASEQNYGHSGLVSLRLIVTQTLKERRLRGT